MQGETLAGGGNQGCVRTALSLKYAHAKRPCTPLRLLKVLVKLSRVVRGRQLWGEVGVRISQAKISEAEASRSGGAFERPSAVPDRMPREWRR